MARRIVAVAALLTLALGCAASAQQTEGATIIFARNGVLIYQGVGERRAAEPTREPVSVGNFVIEQVLLPSESDLGDFGLTMPYRNAYYQSHMNLQTWGWVQSRNGLCFVCRAKDVETPVGFWMRASARDRGEQQGWLYLDVGPNAWDRRPAVTANRRYHSGTHRWYVDTDLEGIYGPGREVRDLFAIVLGTGGWGAYSIEEITIRPYKITNRE